jgi:neutral trehalase
MHEKYDVEKQGYPGGGGEYRPQVCVRVWAGGAVALGCALVPASNAAIKLTSCGGGGGVLQIGFGWSNGVVLDFLAKHY